MKVSPGFFHVPANLLSQSVYGRELDLIAQTFEEADFNFSFRSQVQGMEAQQVGFDGIQIRSKCRTVAHIRDRIKTLAADARPGDVDAVLGNEFLVAGQVDGGHGVFRAVAAAAAWCAENAKWTRQKMARAADASGSEQLANLAAGDGFPAQGHLGIDLDIKSHLAPEFGHQIHVAGRFVTESKIEAFVHFGSVQPFFQNALGELSRRHQRELATEGKDEHDIEPGGVKLTATAFALLALVRETIGCNTCACARWTPSKLPTLTSAGPKSAGTSSSLWKTCIDKN